MYYHTITSYVRVQPITKKQAVACPPQQLIAETLNTVDPVAAADSHISVCLISKIPVAIVTYLSNEYVHVKLNFHAHSYIPFSKL